MSYQIEKGTTLGVACLGITHPHTSGRVKAFKRMADVQFLGAYDDSPLLAPFCDALELQQRSKEEILVAVMNNGIQEVIDGGERALAHYDAPADRLAALFRVHMWSMLQGAGGDAMNALVYEWRSLSAPSQSAVKALSDRYEAMWQSVVADAVQTGLIQGDARVIKRCVLGAMNLTVQWYKPGGRLAPAAFIDAMLLASLPALPEGAGAWPLDAAA